MIVAGVDGYPRGWLVLRCEFDRRGSMKILDLQGHAGFRSVVASRDDVIAVDIPIGLLERSEDGPRRCDVEARKLLGKRGVSVFPAPPRRALTAGSYEQAKALAPMSLQTFGILRKVADVDRVMDPRLQARVREAHPEVSFREMPGAPREMRSKTSAEGRAQRVRLLDRLGLDVAALLVRRPNGAGIDDVLDAAAMVWTAARVSFAQARAIPADAHRDAYGLKMEIWV